MPGDRWGWIEALYRHALRREPRPGASAQPFSHAEPGAFQVTPSTLVVGPGEHHAREDETHLAAGGEPGAADPGSRIGPYEILAPLGAGAMGRVFSARDTKLGRDVAIKMLSPALVHDPERLARFRREAQLLASLNHPNIAIVHGLEDSAHTPCLVMELIAGRTLEERLLDGPLPVRDALRIGMQMAAALEAAHGHGILHRDVKPANVKVTPDGRVKMLDFGLAKTADGSVSSVVKEMTLPGTVLGTPAYMSPEQLRAEPASQPSDVWAFGCVLYELLTGRQPFRGSTFAEIAATALKDEADLGALPPDVPKPISDLIGQCLDKIPARRVSMLQARQAMEATLAAPDGAQTEERAIRTVAVLPFVNASADPEMEYLSDGLAENAIFNLSQLPSLRVMARGTVFRYKGRTDDPAAIGRELGVDAVLSGRVLQRGDSLVISSELIDVAKGWQLWGMQYRKAASDIVAIEQDITREITNALMPKLSDERKTALTRPYTRNVEAYHLYLKGRFHWGKRTEDSLYKGIAYFRQAIELDPTYALAYAGLAEGYVPLIFYGHVAPLEGIPKVRAAAKAAVEIDPTLAEAQSMLAIVTKWAERDFAAAEQTGRAAIELDPNNPRVRQSLAEFYMHRGRFEEAFAEIRRAMELDPLSLAMHAAAGMVCHFGHRYELAVEYSRKAIEMDAAFFPARWIHGVALEQLGDPAGAVRELELARSLSSNSASMTASLAAALAARGDRAKAHELLSELDDLARHRYVDQAAVACIFAALGDKEGALIRLERARDDQSNDLRRMLVEPRLATLRDEPRFQDIARQRGLQPAP